VVIEEIKTTRSDLDRLEESENPSAWGQLKSYAYIYAVDHELDRIDVQLTYYHLDTEETREVRRGFTIQELENFFQDLVSRYLEWADAVAGWGHERDNSIKMLEFPFPAYRPGQRSMAVEVYRAIRDKGQVLVHASTGIGKTIATIFPAVKALEEGHTEKIFYLTAKTTGRALAEKALDELRAKGLRIKSITLTAKDKICFKPEAACTPEECEFARGYYDRIDDALKGSFFMDSFSREAVEEAARKYNVCPFEFSLDLSLWADCIICDYNYAFDPRASLKRFFHDSENGFTLLIDEAHNLVERSREMFSAQIRKQPFLDMRREIKKQLPYIYKTMGKINAWLVKARKRCGEAGDFISEQDQPERLYPLLRKFLNATEPWLAKNIKTPFREGLLEIYFDVIRFLKVAEEYDESYSTCLVKNGRELQIKLFCIDPSGHLRKTLERCRAGIFFSATMIPAEYFRKMLGCIESAGIIELPSPFPRENLCLLLCDRISTLYRDRERTKVDTAKAIITLVGQKKGNYLLYFPSYEYMMMVYSVFQEECPDVETVCQWPGMTEKERELFIERFAHDNSETLAGFAVMGGVFGEGIDLVGDRLSGAAIVGVGLPGLSPERDVIREYFNNSDRAGFEYAYLYPGINRVFQALGRVIRTEADRGVVLLVDSRFSAFRYRRLFPEWWHPITMRDNRQMERELKGFWGSAQGA
jgi:DNA excision repair protein ERCC-2